MDTIQPICLLKHRIHYKKWGLDNGIGEVWIVNNDLYCLKILKFGAGKKFSNHFHWKKDETWYVTVGQLVLKSFDLKNGTEMQTTLNPGDIINIPPGNPHQLTAIIDSVIYEVSTKHDDSDSYRIAKGDSQN
jgi:mannose-6-phosphate isomerase-like protein (cupin superfamily)